MGNFFRFFVDAAAGEGVTLDIRPSIRYNKKRPK